MKTKHAEIQTNSNNAQTQGFQAPIRAYLSKDGQYLTHVLPGGMRITKHVNFYKAILGVTFTPKTKSAGEGVEANGSQVA